MCCHFLCHFLFSAHVWWVIIKIYLLTYLICWRGTLPISSSIKDTDREATHCRTISTRNNYRSWGYNNKFTIWHFIVVRYLLQTRPGIQASAGWAQIATWGGGYPKQREGRTEPPLTVTTAGMWVTERTCSGCSPAAHGHLADARHRVVDDGADIESRFSTTTTLCSSSVALRLFADLCLSTYSAASSFSQFITLFISLSVH